MQVEFLFDYASPYSFLASESLATRLPDVAIDYRPTYLRGFESFATAVPFTAAKLAYTITDLRRCAAALDLELRIPPTFPINGLFALRGAVVAQRTNRFPTYHRAMFRAAWLDGRDISTKPAFTAVATELGFADIAAAIDEPAIKDALRANTDHAIARGAFGLPTFFVGRELFWGHDRLDHVAREVARVRG
jgi:2-hydroxychromene-2-carboxylate isomerase